MKFKSLILLVVSVFVLFSCDDGIKFDNPNDINSDAYNPSDTDTQTNDDDSDKTDTMSEYDDEKTDTVSENDEDEALSDDSDSDSAPDDADSINDSGDSELDENNSDDDSDSTDSEPDSSDSTPDEDTDTDSGDSTPDEDADTDSGDSTPDQDADTDTTPTNPCNPNPCGGIANSTGVCTVSGTGYSCACNSGYFWNGQKCAVLPECSATSGTPCKDSTSQLTWSKKATNTMNWQTAVNYCNGYTEGGFSSWHLPNISELRTLVQNCAGTVTGGSCGVIDTGDPATSCLNYSCYNNNNCLCAEDLSGNYSKFGDIDWFWSSSTNPGDNYAWRISFTIAQTATHDKDTERYVRCVRCEDGYFWNGSTCAVLPECSATSGTPCKDSTSLLIWSKKAENTMAWQDAKNYCIRYTEGGFSSWHLPNIDELKTLLINADKILTECDLSETNNCLSISNCWSCETCMETGTAATSGNTCSNWGTSYSDGRYSKFKETGWFWSSSTQSANSNNAFGISFNVGGISDYARSYDHDVRCVR